MSLIKSLKSTGPHTSRPYTPSRHTDEVRVLRAESPAVPVQPHRRHVITLTLRTLRPAVQVERLFPHVVREQWVGPFVHDVGADDNLEVALAHRRPFVARVLPEHQRRAGFHGRHRRFPLVGPPVHAERFVDDELTHAGSLWRDEHGCASTHWAPVQVHQHGVERPSVHVHDGCAVGVRREVTAGFVPVEEEVVVHPARLPRPAQPGLPHGMAFVDDHRRHHQVGAPPPQFVRDRRAVNLHGVRIAKLIRGRRRVPEAVTRTLGAFNQSLALGCAHHVVEDERVEGRWKCALGDFGNLGAGG